MFEGVFRRQSPLSYFFKLEDFTLQAIMGPLHAAHEAFCCPTLIPFVIETTPDSVVLHLRVVKEWGVEGRGRIACSAAVKSCSQTEGYQPAQNTLQPYKETAAQLYYSALVQYLCYTLQYVYTVCKSKCVFERLNHAFHWGTCFSLGYTLVL